MVTKVRVFITFVLFFTPPDLTVDSVKLGFINLLDVFPSSDLKELDFAPVCFPLSLSVNRPLSTSLSLAMIWLVVTNCAWWFSTFL